MGRLMDSQNMSKPFPNSISFLIWLACALMASCSLMQVQVSLIHGYSALCLVTLLRKTIKNAPIILHQLMMKQYWIYWLAVLAAITTPVHR